MQLRIANVDLIDCCPGKGLIGQNSWCEGAFSEMRVKRLRGGGMEPMIARICEDLENRRCAPAANEAISRATQTLISHGNRASITRGQLSKREMPSMTFTDITTQSDSDCENIEQRRQNTRTEGNNANINYW